MEQEIWIALGMTDRLKKSTKFLSIPLLLLYIYSDSKYNLKEHYNTRTGTINTYNVNHYYSKKTFTWFGRTGASHIWRPSRVSFTPSTNFSGVRTSPLTPSSTFTLSGNAPISGINYQFSLFVTIWITEELFTTFTKKGSY